MHTHTIFSMLDFPKPENEGWGTCFAEAREVMLAKLDTIRQELAKVGIESEYTDVMKTMETLNEANPAHPALATAGIKSVGTWKDGITTNPAYPALYGELRGEHKRFELLIWFALHETLFWFIPEILMALDGKIVKEFKGVTSVHNYRLGLDLIKEVFGTLRLQ
jgi:hypothetical protein